MTHSMKSFAGALCCLALPVLAVAKADLPSPDPADQTQRDAEVAEPQAEAAVDVEGLKERLSALGAGLEVKSIVESAIDNIYEVEIQGGDYFYLTADGRYLLSGNLYELRDDSLVAITEQRRDAKRRELIANIPAAETLSFTPTDGARASVLVFTDTDCGFCRRLHTSMADYHAHGIEVRYLAYPRAGVGSPTYEKMVSAWCADDPLDALTALKRGEEIPSQSCINPVAEQYELGQQVGLTGTPSFVLPDGRMLSGLVGAEDLAKLLGI